MKTENSKTNESYKSNFNLSQRIDLQSSLKKCWSSKIVCLLHVEKYKKTL